MLKEVKYQPFFAIEFGSVLDPDTLFFKCLLLKSIIDLKCTLLSTERSSIVVTQIRIQNCLDPDLGARNR